MEKDYSLRRGMQLIISDFMLIFPFLVSFIAALIIEAIIGPVSTRGVSESTHKLAPCGEEVP